MKLSIYTFSFHRVGEYFRAKVHFEKECYGWVEMPNGVIGEWRNMLEACLYLAYAYTGKEYLVQ